MLIALLILMLIMLTVIVFCIFTCPDNINNRLTRIVNYSSYKY